MLKNKYRFTLSLQNPPTFWYGGFFRNRIKSTGGRGYFMGRFSDVSQEDVFVSKEFLSGKFKIHNKDLARLGVIVTEEGVSVWHLLTRLNDEYRKVEGLVSDSSNLDLSTLEIQSMDEKLLSIKIKNQTALGDLMGKDDIQHRVLDLLNNYCIMVIAAIRNGASQIGLEFNIEDIRRLEEILSGEYTKVIHKVVEDSGEVVTWGEDGTANLLRTRLQKNVRDSEDVEKEINNYKRKKEKGTPLSLKDFELD